MELLLNGKPFERWTLSDLQVLVNSPEDYRENEFIDYKKDFALLKIPTNKPDLREKEKQEFCNDICSFANAESGYIFWGITEDHGKPKELHGISIPDNNTDKFELDRRNEFSRIQPTSPDVQFKFIQTSEDKYIVIAHIKKGIYAPYTCKEPDGPYYFYKREGNGKRPMGYSEIRRGFNQSLELSKEIRAFIEDRIDTLRTANLQDKSINTKGLAILHIVPDDFQNNINISKMYLKEKNRECSFQAIFHGHCNSRSIPFCDGLFFRNYSYNDGIQVRIYNNGIAELCLNMDNFIFSKNKVHSEEKWLYSKDLTDNYRNFAEHYISNSKVFSNSRRIFLCAAIVDADGIFTDENIFTDYVGRINASYNICTPIEVYDATNDDVVAKSLNDLITVVCLTCGIKSFDQFLT